MSHVLLTDIHTLLGNSFAIFRACMCRAGAFVFSFDISTGYPHDAPKVKCQTKVDLMTHTTSARQFSSGRSPCFFLTFCISGVPSKHRSGGKCVPEHPQGGLEACAQHQFHHIWPSIPVHGKLHASLPDWSVACALGSTIWTTVCHRNGVEALSHTCLWSCFAGPQS